MSEKPKPIYKGKILLERAKQLSPKNQNKTKQQQQFHKKNNQIRDKQPANWKQKEENQGQLRLSNQNKKKSLIPGENHKKIIIKSISTLKPEEAGFKQPKKQNKKEVIDQQSPEVKNNQRKIKIQITPSTPQDYKKKQAVFQINSSNNSSLNNSSKNIIKIDLKCSICQQSMGNNNILKIQNCNHCFHQKCLSGFVSNNLSQTFLKIRCPSSQCGTVIKQSFLKKYLSKQLMEKYWKYQSQLYLQTLIRQKRIFRCKQSGCDQFFVKFNPNKEYFCKTTKNKICNKCMLRQHPKISSCEEYARSLDPNSNQHKMLLLAKQNNWMQCNKCYEMIQKNQGCVHIKCRCGYDFCYKCGGPFPNCVCAIRGGQVEWHRDFYL